MVHLRHDFDASTTEAVGERNVYVVRIVLTASRRRHLAEMARQAGQAADALASQLLSDMIDEDVRGHAPTPPAPVAKEVKKAKPAPRAAPPRKPDEPPAPPPVEVNGVTVDFAKLRITFCGESVHVSLRQAHLVAVLARVMPNLMRLGDWSARAWPDLSAESGKAMIYGCRAVLTERLASIGLVLRYESGIGFALQAGEG